MNPMKRTFSSLFSLCTLAAALFVASGCDTVEEHPPERIALDAVVQVFVIGEGPITYLLQPLDGARPYYPLNLPKEYHAESLHVRVEGFLRHYEVLLHPALEITRIQLK